MSIYLPDDLANQLKDVESSTPTSQVVQEALRRYLGAVSAPSWARPPDGAAELLAVATQKLIEQAHADYQAGYQSALGIIPHLDWDELTGFARCRYDLESWIQPWCNTVLRAIANREEVVLPSLLKLLAPILGPVADPLGIGPNARRTNAFERGFGDGLRDAYELVEGGTASLTSETSASGSDEAQPPDHNRDAAASA